MDAFFFLGIRNTVKSQLDGLSPHSDEEEK